MSTCQELPQFGCCDDAVPEVALVRGAKIRFVFSLNRNVPLFVAQNLGFLSQLGALLDSAPLPSGPDTEKTLVNLFSLTFSIDSDLRAIGVQMVLSGVDGTNLSSYVAPPGFPPPAEFAWVDASSSFVSFGGRLTIFEVSKMVWALGSSRFPACVSESMDSFGVLQSRTCIAGRLTAPQSGELWSHTGLEVRLRSYIPPIETFLTGNHNLTHRIRLDVRDVNLGEAGFDPAACCDLSPLPP